MKTRIFTLSILLFFCMIGFGQAPSWAWAQTAGGNADDEAEKVSADGYGNVYIAGGFNSSTVAFGSTTLTNTGASDPYVAKYDASGNILWARSGSGSSNDAVYGMVADAAGNVYLCGYFDSPTLTFDRITLTNVGASDAFVVKYDPSGNVVWAKQSGGSSYDQMQAIAVDATGNVYVCGIYQNDSFTIGSITLNSDGDNDSFIAKYDSSGNVLWAKQIAGSSWDNVNGIGVDGNGYAYVAGDFGSPTLTLGSISLTNTSGTSAFVAKSDANGNALWAKNSTGSSAVAISTMAVDRSGNSFITGYIAGAVQFGSLPVLNTAGGSDFCLARYDTNGNAMWAQSAGGSGSEASFGLAVDASSNTYATGYFGSTSIDFGSTTLTNDGAPGDVTIYVVKYDSSGNVVWALNPAGSTNDMGEGMAVDESGNILVSGGYGSPELTFGSTTLTNNGVYNIFVAKLGGCNAPQPVITASGATTFCTGDSVRLTSSSANSYLWSNNATTQAITVTGQGGYTVMTSAGAGCSVTSVPIVIRVVPAVNVGRVTASPDTICSGFPVSLKLNDHTGDTLHWQSALTPGIFNNITNATDTLYNTSLSQTTYLRVYISNGVCSDTSSPVMVLVHPAVTPPTLTTPDSIICASDSARINTSGSYASYSWSDGDTTAYTYANEAGGNWVTVTDANGCTAVSAHQNIEVFPTGGIPYTVKGDTLASFDMVSYQWYRNDTLIPGATSNIYVATQTAYYSLHSVDGNGCKTVSNAIQIIVNGLSVLSNDIEFNIFPSPADQLLFIKLNLENIEGKLEIYNSAGQFVIEKLLMKEQIIPVMNLAPGIYSIVLQSGGRSYSKEFVVEHQ